ncbi:MAG: helix-turn-helix domain-containing protein [Bryobacteraceae bacterium]|nr:helix-turn-helix domain-containing protein [Bryobacteraceae bacterium]
METKRNLLTLNEVATILHVSYARAAELARTHILPIVRLGRQVRVDQEVLECFIRDGGRALPGGWKRSADGVDAEVRNGR